MTHQPAAPPAARTGWPASVGGWAAIRQRNASILPGAPLMVVFIAGTRGAGHTQDARASVWAYGLAAVAALSLLLRRRAPLVGMSIAAVATAVYLLLDQVYGPILFAAPIWAWVLAAALPLRTAVPWLAGYAVLVIAAGVPRGLEEDGVPGLVAWATAVVLILAAGAATGSALAARRRSELAARAEAARRAVSEERLAMAQDVHDGVGHSLAVIALHAGVAAHVIDRDPARAKELLGTLAATSREALDGLRADLDRLRSPNGAAARAPSPGLADLPPLLDRMRGGGLSLSVDLDPATVLRPEVGAVAYRIVQESLTNVLRHAGSAEASVAVRADGDHVVVEVADRGRGGDPGPGSGIDGMRRRAASVGGTLRAGPRDSGGFRVRAELPA
jgi:signal transduction histidine kinase